jgi:hypothetical protein
VVKSLPGPINLPVISDRFQVRFARGALITPMPFMNLNLIAARRLWKPAEDQSGLSLALADE